MKSFLEKYENYEQAQNQFSRYYSLLIEWNEKFFQRMAIKYSNEACRNCVILPICNGSCTQNKIEAGLKNTCFLSMTEDAKQDYLKARVNEIIKACIKQKIHNSTQK